MHINWVAEKDLLNTQTIKPKKCKKGKKVKKEGKWWQSVRLETLEGLADYLNEEIPENIKEELK